MDGSSAKLNKTVVILTPGFAADEDDTQCIPALQDYVDALHHNYPDLRLFVLSFQYPFRSGWYKWKNIDVYSAGGKNSKYVFKLRTWLRIYTQLKRLHKKYGISVVHSFWLTEAALLAQWFTSGKKIKHIATLFGQDALPANRYLKILNLNKFTIVGNSDFVSEKLRETTGREVDKVIHFGLLDHLINNDINDIRTYDVIGVGSLIKLKNYELFIEIINDVKKDSPSIKTAIVGRGIEQQRLQDLIIEFGLQDNIELKGSLPRNEAINLMRKSKILLHTSGYESAGYVFLEALTSGCHVVSFPVGYVPESEKVHRCKNPDEIIAKVKFLLRSNLKFNQEPVPSINETVQKFVALYLE